MFIVINKKAIQKIVCFLILILLIIAAIRVKPVKTILKRVYPLKYNEMIEKYSVQYELDPYLVMAVISAESKFDETAQSHKNAKGLMQLTDDTAKWICEKYDIEYPNNIYEPETNIHIGCAYIGFLLYSFDNDIKTAIAAYNAGQGNVNKWLAQAEHTKDGETLSSIPFAETDKYVETVLKRINIYKSLY